MKESVEDDALQALRALACHTEAILEGGLVSVIAYGSLSFGDLAPGYGDLDFVAVVSDDLSDRQMGDLLALRQRLR